MKIKWKILILVPLSVIICDQISKFIISNTMFLGQSIRVIGSFVRITYVRNPNAAFGIPVGPPLLMMVLTSIATLLLIFYFSRLKEKGCLLYVGLAMIIGGAIGNLIDRFRIQQVIDFIDVSVKRFHWPVFNIADSFVTIGIIVILWAWIFGEKKERVPDKTLTNSSNVI
ncbi:MAG: signal peptidase II [Candidatus Cloacimonadota bacterium]|nr:MAG: signal peptidase II [Candidatus Cloacimonadota bacterium]